MSKNRFLQTFIYLLCFTFLPVGFNREIQPVIAENLTSIDPIYIAQNQSKNPLEETEWQLVSWDENQPLADEPATLSFTKDRLSGSSGCNRYTAGYAIQDNIIKVGVIAATRMACPEALMTQENLLLSALEGAKVYTINPQNQLQIAYIKQKKLGILTFKPGSNSNVPTTEKTVYISPQTVDCIGVSPKQCLQVKEKIDEKWTLFYESIEGFEYEPGYGYQLRIAQKKIPNPPADRSRIGWSLIEIISKTPETKRANIWLDQALNNWNQAGQVIPNAPKIDADPPSIERCQDQLREAKSPQEKAITRAGWDLYGPVQIYDTTTVVTAMSGVDGMCRPLGYQAFVFVEGQFAGTLSPKVLNSRLDGDISRIFLSSSSQLWVEYKRYQESDPLCCPSGISRVSFKIEPREAKPLLIPVEVTTEDES